MRTQKIVQETSGEGRRRRRCTVERADLVVDRLPPGVDGVIRDRAARNERVQVGIEAVDGVAIIGRHDDPPFHHLTGARATQPGVGAELGDLDGGRTLAQDLRDLGTREAG